MALSQGAIEAARRRAEKARASGNVELEQRALALIGANTPSTTDTMPLTTSSTGTMPASTGSTDVKTYGEIGQDMAEADYTALTGTMEDLGIDTASQPSSLEQFYVAQAARNAESAAYQMEQADYSQERMVEQTALARGAARSQAEAAAGALTSGGREGVTSGSNIATVDRLRSATDTYVNRLIADSQNYAKQIAETKAQITAAEQAGNMALAEKYRSTLTAYEQQAKAIDTEYINALSAQLSAESDYEKTQAAITQSGIQTFQSIVEQGTIMDYNTIAGYAQQLNLPTDLLMGYYQGTENIRNDKTIDQATKEIQYAQLSQDLSDQVNGLRTTQAANVDYLKQLYRDGASAEIISAFKSAAGITDLNDPVTQAELRYKNAQTAYQQSATASNLQDLLTAQQQYNDIYGAQTYIPTGSGYEVTVAPDGSVAVGVVDGQTLDLPGTERREDWCGAFTNDVLGTSFGDSIEQKKSLINSTVPAAGMAFVQETSDPYGHVGIVESVDLANGTMTVVESNWQKGEDKKGIVSRRTMNIADAAGFVKPESSYSTTATDDPFSNYFNEYKAKGYSDEDARVKADEKVEEDVFNERTVMGQLDQNEVALREIEEIFSILESRGAEGRTGLSGSIVSFVPGTDAYDIEAKLETIKAIIGFEKLQEMRNASKTGGALGQVSEMENKLLQSVRGSLKIGQSPDEFLESLGQVKESLEKVNDAIYEDYGLQQEESLDPYALTAEDDPAQQSFYNKYLTE